MLWGLFAFSFFASLVGTRAAIGFLTRRAILDTPNARSSHDVPTPRGAGLAVIPVVFIGFIVALAAHPVAWPTHSAWWAMLIGLALLSGVSWLDDLRENGVRRRVRILVQIVAVVLPLLFWPGEWGRLFPDLLPLWAERVLMALGWLWFLNLYNFMDGINGITGVQTASLGAGLLALAYVLPSDVMTGIGQSGAILLGVALGFLFWNGRRHARIFLGDVGSVGLGYVAGWLLLVLASLGHVVPALILPLVYLSDATFTILKRAAQRKKIWDAHREHLYQQATGPGGLSHMRTSLCIAGINVILIALAVCAAVESVTLLQSFGAAAAAVFGLLLCFYTVGKKSRV
jgi:UDP-N-acetylmuramyl pentapeptide phosphotransferase/UDP-N-acetylglucosamine-1-phosphate transferase